MTSFFNNVANGCRVSADDVAKMVDKFKELGDLAMAGLAQAIYERLNRLANEATDETHEQISDDCGRSARGIDQMAERFNELDEDKMVELAEAASARLGQLAFDAMAETQPISMPTKNQPKD